MELCYIYRKINKIHTRKFREGSPASMAMFLDIFDKFLIFFRGPGTVLEATLVTARRPAHFQEYKTVLYPMFFTLRLGSL
jgi:hypothetical protein